MEWVIIGIVMLLAAISLLWLTLFFNKKIALESAHTKLYKNTAEYLEDKIVIFSPNFEVLFANKSARKLLGVDAHYENKPMRSDVKLASERTEPKTFQELFKEKKKEDTGLVNIETLTLSVGEKKHRIHLYMDYSKWNYNNAVICVLQDASADLREKETLKRLGEVDFLTELPSQFKAAFDINKLAVDAQKNSERFALFMFNIHGFSRMKLSKGHAYANSLVKKFSEFLKAQEGDGMTTYRLDGDQFLVVVSHFKREKIVIDMAREITADLSRRFKEENQTLHIVSSVGVALFPDHGKNANKLIDRAHAALNEASQKGNGAIVVFEEKKGESENETQLIRDLTNAIKNKEFIIHFQPIYQSETMQVSGAQSLLVWNHPKNGQMSSDKFMTIAENAGLRLEIMTTFVKEVIRQRKLWNEFKFRNIQLFLEVSHTDLREDSFFGEIASAIEKQGIDPSFITFDVTSSIYHYGIKQCHEEFEHIKRLGVKLCAENLGLGKETLLQMEQIGFSTLKINPMLLAEINKKNERRPLLEATIDFAHALDMDAYASDVKTNKEADILSSLECDHVSGDHYSKHMAAFELQEFLR